MKGAVRGGEDVWKNLSLMRREKEKKKSEEAGQQEQGTDEFCSIYQVMIV